MSLAGPRSSQICDQGKNVPVALHPDKTRRIRFGRPAPKQREKLEERKPETFEFLGFTRLRSR
jgi:RNA-directed DNA polymerase